MADSFDVVAVRVADEGGEIMRMVLGAERRLAVVLPSRVERFLVKLGHGFLGPAGKRDMDRRKRFCGLKDPEILPTFGLKASMGFHVRRQNVSERLQGPLVKLPAFSIVENGNGNVIEHTSGIKRAR